MKRNYKVSEDFGSIIPVIIGLCILNLSVFSQSPIKILPLGNSITYDDNSLDKTNPRPVGDRIAYRYTLFQLLNNAGYYFDFVGSENSGNNYFQDPEFDDNAGFPGIETWQLTNLISTGHNSLTGIDVSQGPYLESYPADIILLHIGTNNLIESAADVVALIDTIRIYDTDAVILVARIINRHIYYPLPTTYNNNVESMVNSRGDDRIIIVRMESGAGINYETDMADNLHPNPTGFDKMAHKWFEAIGNLNRPPEIAVIPEQIISKGNTFPEIPLDDYVYDTEDSDDLLTWTFEQQAETNLEVSIDDNRIMHVVPYESWHGSEIVKLTVEDSGNGLFRKRDSIDVLFTINDPPVITSVPTVAEIEINETYQYIMTATDPDVGDRLTFYPVNIPGWLNFSLGVDAAILTGIATENDVGLDSIKIMVSDGHYSVYQEFSLEVTFPAGNLPDHTPENKIYPNPAGSHVIIRNEFHGSYSVDIFSLHGQLVYHSEMEGRSAQIDLSSFRKGTYFITIRSGEFVKTHKVIKL